MTQTHHQSVFERHPKKTLAILTLTFVMLVDFAAANLLAALDLYQPQYRIERYYRIKHDIYHHTLAANITHSQAQWGPIGYRVNTNSLGMKDNSARQIPLTSKQKRLLFIGDSFTEGVGYEYSQTFVGIIDKKLRENNIEVLNAAVSSYSPIIYLRKTQHLLDTVGLEFDHLVVAIDLSDIIDEANSYSFDNNMNIVDARDSKANELDERFKRFISENSILLNSLRNYLHNMKKQNPRVKSLDDGLNVYRGSWPYNDAAYQTYGLKGIKLAKKYMTELADRLKERKIKLTIVVYPWPDQVVQNDLESKQVKIWSDWARDHNIAFINLFPTFIPTEQPRKTVEKYFLIGDVHWNIAGHRLIAEKLLDQLNP